MARIGRIKHKNGGYYHIYNRVAGPRKFFAFRDFRIREFFLQRLWHYMRCCGLKMASFVLMGNHYHLVTLLEEFQKLSRKELEARARLYYGEKWKRYTANWSRKRWKRFNRRLYDLSDIIGQFQSDFTRWFNRTFDRRGSAWADRFGSTCLASLKAVQECVFYTELNPVRAKLVKFPELWKFGSALLRFNHDDDNLVPLSSLFPDQDSERLWEVYRERLLHCGKLIADQVELAQVGHSSAPGAYLKRMGCFTSGLLLGTAADAQMVLDDLIQRGIYRKKRSPVAHSSGLFFSVRPAAGG